MKHRTVLSTQTLLETRNLVSLRLQVKGIFLCKRLVRISSCPLECSQCPRHVWLLPRPSSCPTLFAAPRHFSDQTLVCFHPPDERHELPRGSSRFGTYTLEEFRVYSRVAKVNVSHSCQCLFSLFRSGQRRLCWFLNRQRCRSLRRRGGG